jgi:hypothetical protein
MRRPDVVRACDALLAVLSWLYLAFAYVVIEYGVPYSPVCPFLLLTGAPCPLCGSTRLIGRYLHGGLGAAPADLPKIGWFVFLAVLTIISTARTCGGWLVNARNWMRYRCLTNKTSQRTGRSACKSGLN